MVTVDKSCFIWICFPQLQIRRKAELLMMEFREYLQQKIQDEDWVWEVTEKYGLNEYNPRYAKTMLVIRARSEWLRLDKTT